MINFLSYVGSLLLLLTVGTSLYEARRRREAQRLDILFVLGTFVVVLILRRPTAGRWFWAASTVLLAALPFFILRLIRHFRDVPVTLYRVTQLVPIGAITFLVWPQRMALLAIAGYATVIFSYASIALAREARRTSGVTAMRLEFAGIATVLLAAQFLIGGLSDLMPQLSEATGSSSECLTFGMFACYYLAFTPPRQLVARWQRTEQARFLTASAGRDPEDRGTRAAKDLDQAVRRSMGNACIVVALRPDPAAGDLIVRATTEMSLTGLKIVPAAPGLVARATETGAAVTGTPGQAEAELAPHFAALGARVLVAPIRTATQTWGAVAVVQRRGSLFPEDDLTLLAQFGRYTGTALDHAHLFVESRERERQVADRRVHAVESQMGVMLDSIKDYAMFVLDRRGRVQSWHIGARQIFGYTAAEMDGRSVADLFTMTEEQFTAFVQDALAAGHGRREGPCVRRDGVRFIGATTLRPLESESGESSGLVAVTRDVTEQREFEGRLRQSQKMEAIGQLAGGIAHDFNNLLTAIFGNAEYLATALKDDDERRQEVGEIQKAAERAAALTRQLLAFTRRKMVEPRAIELSRLVGDLLPMLRRMIGEQVEIVEETVSDSATVLGDRSQVEQIVVNLAVNARDAMPSGGRLKIQISAVWLDDAAAAGDVPPGAYVVLEVTDTGVGMDAATMSRIFEPFFTTKEFGAGTGLGLATVYGNARQMGGMVRVQSEIGRGTTFRVYFPETRDREAVAHPGAAPEMPRGTETLLLIEDDDSVRHFMLGTLRRHGYQVLAASHPAAAVAIVEAHRDPIHLVITDMMLPGGTGPELVATLAQIRPGLPTLYISGYADGVLAREDTLPKASHFLQKPFTAADLLTRLRQILSAA